MSGKKKVDRNYFLTLLCRFSENSTQRPKVDRNYFLTLLCKFCENSGYDQKSCEIPLRPFHKTKSRPKLFPYLTLQVLRKFKVRPKVVRKFHYRPKVVRNVRVCLKGKAVVCLCLCVPKGNSRRRPRVCLSSSLVPKETQLRKCCA